MYSLVLTFQNLEIIKQSKVLYIRALQPFNLPPLTSIQPSPRDVLSLFQSLIELDKTLYLYDFEIYSLNSTQYF